MERFEKCDEGSRFRRTQILSVSWHVAASLDYLADQLVPRQSNGDAVEGRSSLTTQVSERMAIAALFDLKDERTSSFQSRGAPQKLLRNGVTAPSVHVRAPRRIASEVGECSQDYGNQQNCQNSDWPPAPTLFPFSRKKWQQNKKRDNDYKKK
jgi:hypothetical protein